MVMETAGAARVEDPDTAVPEAPINPRKRLAEASVWEDLGAPESKKAAPLQLSRMERYVSLNLTLTLTFTLTRYFSGPTPAASQDYLTQDELAKSRLSLKEELARWREGRNPAVLSSKVQHYPILVTRISCCCSSVLLRHAQGTPPGF